LNNFEVSKDFFTRKPDTLNGVWVEAAAVPNGQQAIGSLAGVDHLLAFFDGNFHRLFAQDMFAGLGRLDGVLGVQGIGRNDINNINIRVVAHLFHRVVVVDIFVWNVVLRFPFFGFGGMAGDNPGKTAIFRQLQSRCDLIGAQAAQAANSKSKLAVGVSRPGARGQMGDQLGAGGGQRSRLDKMAAALQGSVHNRKACNGQVFSARILRRVSVVDSM
jgi:hypothetical protein